MGPLDRTGRYAAVAVRSDGRRVPTRVGDGTLLERIAAAIERLRERLTPPSGR